MDTFIIVLCFFFIYLIFGMICGAIYLDEKQDEAVKSKLAAWVFLWPIIMPIAVIVIIGYITYIGFRDVYVNKYDVGS